MTEYELAVIERLDQLVYFAQVAAYGVCWAAGAITWRLTLLAKNQRNIW